MKLQELLIHSLWFLMAAFFAGNTHADNHNIPVSEATHQPYIAEETATKQQYVQAEPSQVPPPPPSASQIKSTNQELLSKIESLQDEMQKLRGRLEVQNHDMQVMRSQQQALYRDLDSRLAKAESMPKAQTTETKPKANTITEEGAEDNGDAFYQAAYQMLQNKQYPRAISAFQVFLKNYPNSHYAANAHYWLGELYLSQGFIDKAKQEFNLVISTYPKSSKVPASLLKLGFAHYDNGEWQKARQTLQKVKQTYPDTDTARMAASRISDMDQQGL